MSEVANIYNNLFRFESKVNQGSYPIHKILKFKGEKNLLDFIIDKVHFNKGEYVLDAGCGTGHTLFYLNKVIEIFGRGISVSIEEVSFANRENERLKSTGNIQFDLMDYDEPLDAKYDKIFCIESLKHSSNLEHSLINLLNTLQENGSLIIAEDFLAEDSSKSTEHKELWQAPSFCSLVELKSIIGNLKQFDIVEYELTDRVPYRSVFKMTIAKILVNILTIFPFSKFNTNLKTYKGAILLEYLYKMNQVSYWILIIKKKHNGNHTWSI